MRDDESVIVSRLVNWNNDYAAQCVHHFIGKRHNVCVIINCQLDPSAMKTPRFLQISHDDPAASRRELVDGLRAESASISPKYFYDALGARLFAAITELPEYYPTRTEAAIFAQHGTAMAVAIESCGGAKTLVDLGAGNCEKAARLFAHFGVQCYVAVDISIDYLAHSLGHLQREHPALDLMGIGMDFSRELTLPAELGNQPRLIQLGLRLSF